MKTENLKLGVYGGLVGGVVFGGMMAMMGMLPMIGSMVGHPSAALLTLTNEGKKTSGPAGASQPDLKG